MKYILHIILALSALLPIQSSLATEPKATVEQEYQSLITLFFAAARTGNNDVITEFLNAGFPVDQHNEKSYTALMVAAYRGHADTVLLLLDSKANACLQDKRGNTALMGAIVKGEIQIARNLYRAECDQNIRNKAGLSLDEFAALYGQSEQLKMLHQEKIATPLP